MVEPADAPEESRYVRILAALAGKANLADFRKAVPVAREFSPLNETDADVKEPPLAATAVPSFQNPKTGCIDNLGAEQTVCLSVHELSLGCASHGHPPARPPAEREPHDARDFDRKSTQDSLVSRSRKNI